ncbi:urokinase plasminogen activator surface receptor-like [Lissotriton helveticus]
MWVFFTTVIFLASLITEGSSLTCESCLSVNVSSCSGSLNPCQKGVTQCISGLRNITTGTNVKLTAFKGCGEPGKKGSCGKEVVVTTADVSIQITQKCCDSEKCNNNKFQVPPVNETANGYKCPTCFMSISSNGCTPTEDILCVGMENLCVNYIKTSQGSGKPVKRYIIQGCATTDACGRGHFDIAPSKLYYFDLKCFPSNKVKNAH